MRQAAELVLPEVHGTEKTCFGEGCFWCVCRKQNALLVLLLTCAAAACGVTQVSLRTWLVQAGPERLCSRSCSRSKLGCYFFSGNTASVVVLYVAAQIGGPVCLGVQVRDQQTQQWCRKR
jgi:hypothetical protein